MSEKKYVGSIEAGGTKFIVAVQDVETGEEVARDRIPTTTNKETLEKTAEFFKKHPVDALGIGTFGPIDINPNSRTYGYILDTPKPGWSGTNVKGFFERELGIPVAMTTDVNASCYGEYVARGRDDSKSYFYATVGTGVGAGIVQAGKLLGLNNHPEMGHMLVRRYPGDDYEGHSIMMPVSKVWLLVQVLKAELESQVKSCHVITRSSLIPHITLPKCSSMFIWLLVQM